MASGGARNRTGQVADPNSARSDQRGFKLSELPAQGYDGEVPEFPLPDASLREVAVWNDAWRTPQACAWSMPSERWRIRTVAMWVRLSVRCEEVDSSSSLLAQLHRFADQVGLTTAGLAEMGWRVAVDQVAVKAAERTVQAEPVARRLRAVGDDK